MSRLSNLLVEDFKKISCVEFDIGGVTEISGPNGSGKSSALDAISVLIDGLAAAPAEPIRNGQQKSVIKGRFGEMTVIRHIERARDGKHTTKIQFQPAGEKPHPATQKQLTALIGEHRLDPMDFLALESKDKFKAFQAFVPGFDFAKSKDRDDADYLRRTEVGRTAKTSRAAADLIDVPRGLPAAPIDERALVDKLGKAGEHNAHIETRKGNRQRATEDVARKRAAAAAALAAIPGASAKIQAQNDQLAAGLKSRIAELESQLTDLREQLANIEVLGSRTVETEEARLRGEGAEHTAQADELQRQIDKAPELPPPIDIVALRFQIDQARETNAAILRNAERSRHVKAAEEAEREYKELTEAMDARREARETAIAAAKIPVPGLEFGDGEIRLHGAPFEQASAAEKLGAAFAYCVASNPSLRLIWVKDASLLDDSTYAEINRLAEEFKCDVLLETVRSIGGNSIVLEDGHVREAQESAA